MQNEPEKRGMNCRWGRGSKGPSFGSFGWLGCTILRHTNKKWSVQLMEIDESNSVFFMLREKA
jgi:hypothetical protein